MGCVLKIFISWSGDSKAVAQAIHDALPRLFDKSRPWMSTENPAGAMWLAEIDQQLSSTDFGIVCVTKRNMNAQWLNFEAGALSRKVGAQRELMPVFLIDFESMEEAKGPITAFQMKMADQNGFFHVVKALNEHKLGPHIDTEILRERVSTVWPSIEATIDAVRNPVSDSAASGIPSHRSDSEKIDEVLGMVRQMATATQELQNRQARFKKTVNHRVLRELDDYVRGVVDEDFSAANPQVSWAEGSDTITVATEGSLGPISVARIRSFFDTDPLKHMRVQFRDLKESSLDPKDRQIRDDERVAREAEEYDAGEGLADKIRDDS